MGEPGPSQPKPVHLRVHSQVPRVSAGGTDRLSVVSEFSHEAVPIGIYERLSLTLLTLGIRTLDDADTNQGEVIRATLGLRGHPDPIG